jgi:hypothetical protein
VVYRHRNLISEPININRLSEELATPDLCQEKFEEWQKTDTVAGAFQDPNFIETCLARFDARLTNDVFFTLS